MLQSLAVKNFILIDELEIEFEKGLCVITGETGSGKSILLDAILFCLGDKFSGDVIKQGNDYCLVSAIFTVNNDTKNFLKQIHIECDTELIIKRSQTIGNRKKFLINDQIVTQNTLQQVAGHLFELHGQNSHTALLATSSHIDILDDYADTMVSKVKVAEHFTKWQKIIKEIILVTEEKGKLISEIDYLTFVTAELEKLDIQQDEEEKLASIRHKLQNRDKEISLIRDVLSQLEIPEIDQALSRVGRLIGRSALQKEEFESILLNMDEAYNNLEEARTTLKALINNLIDNEYNLEEVEERLFEIHAIARKYNIHPSEIAEFYNKSVKQLNILKNRISNIGELGAQELAARTEYFKLAEELSKKRCTAAVNLELDVKKELNQLKMEKAIFKVEIIPVKDATRQGIDNVRFIASTNPGMNLAPIDKIASGGELSRFMLAFKTSLLDKAVKQTIIFDEIDTGIGGIVADKVGERLKKLAATTQVIVITHQPQVAGKADQHIMVNKSQLDETTKVTVRMLDLHERQAELARMISGKIVTEAGMKAAKELLHITIPCE